MGFGIVRNQSHPTLGLPDRKWPQAQTASLVFVISLLLWIAIVWLFVSVIF